MDEDQWYALAKAQQSAEWRQGYATAMTDILAAVLALPTRMAHDTRAPIVFFAKAPKVLVVRRDEVIALLTRSNDE